MKPFIHFLARKKFNSLLENVSLISRDVGFPIEDFIRWYTAEGYILPQKDIELLVEGWIGRNLGKGLGAAAGMIGGGTVGGLAGGLGAGAGALAGGAAGWQKGGAWGDQLGDKVGGAWNHAKQAIGNWWNNQKLQAGPTQFGVAGSGPATQVGAPPSQGNNNQSVIHALQQSHAGAPPDMQQHISNTIGYLGGRLHGAGQGSPSNVAAGSGGSYQLNMP